jgi:hypothetical protein
MTCEDSAHLAETKARRVEGALYLFGRVCGGGLASWFGEVDKLFDADADGNFPDI